MSRFSEILRWSLQSDMAFPFLEVVLFLVVYLSLSYHSLIAQDILERPITITSDLIYVIVLTAGIAGARAFSIALDKGELSRQFMTFGGTRLKFILHKFLSFYLTTLSLLVIANVTVFLVFMTSFFSPQVYINLGEQGPVIWVISLLEQMLLLFFLDSLIMVLSLGFRSATISLLLFFVVTILGISFYRLDLPIWTQYMQLGWGDQTMVNTLVKYIFFNSYAPPSLHLPAYLIPSLGFYVGIVYRAIGGIVFFFVSLLRFNSMDLD
jgi:hypothetical protein